jgi:hypothetical protein
MHATQHACVYTYTHIRTGHGQILLEVKHRILQVDVEPIAPHALRGIKHALFCRLASLAHGGASRVAGSALASSARRRIAPALVEEPVYPEPSLLAHDIGVIRGRHEADRLGRARVEIARGVHALLNRVGRQLALVVDHDVVRGLHGPLQPRVRLQVKVEIKHGRHALVDDRPRAGVPVAVGELGVRRVEARVVPLAADDDAQRRVVLWVLGVDALERFEYLGQLFFYYFVVLALRMLSQGNG